MRYLGRAKDRAVSLLAPPGVRVGFGIAVAARAAFLVFMTTNVWGSGRRYIEPAMAFIQGRWAATETIDQLPGAPLFFAPFFLLFGERHLPVVLAQHLMGLASLLFLAGFAKAAWGERAAAWAAALVAIQFILPYQECFLMSESVGQFWFSAAVFLAAELRWGSGAGPRTWLAGGAAAAMAALSRGEFIFLGPLIALLLCLPKKGEARPTRLVARYAGAWALLIGGWTLRNCALGFYDFNPHGPTVLLDTALPLVRYDLPTEPLAKRLLKEQRDICEVKNCDPRPTALYRYEHEYGYSFLEARKAFGRVAREAVMTQPAAFLPMVGKNFLTFFKPIAWVSDEKVDQRSPIKESSEGSAARMGFWRVMEAGPQYAGWAAVVLALFSPLMLISATAKERWGAVLIILCAACVAGTASLFRAVARTQADLYLPLGLAGAFAVDRAWRWAWAESKRD